MRIIGHVVLPAAKGLLNKHAAEVALTIAYRHNLLWKYLAIFLVSAQ